MDVKDFKKVAVIGAGTMGPGLAQVFASACSYHPDSEIAWLAASLPVEVYHPEYETAPSVRCVGIPKRLVAGEVVLGGRDDVCAEGVTIALEGEGTRRETTSGTFGDVDSEGLARHVECRLTIAHDGHVPQRLDVRTRSDVDVGEIRLVRS